MEQAEVLLLQVHVFFNKQWMFFNSASVLLNFFMNWASNVAQVAFNTNKHHHTETLFASFTIFVAMSRPRSIYVLSMWPIFMLIVIFIMINRLNTDALVLLLIFQKISFYFWMITCMKNANNFQIGKTSASGCCLASAWFFANFSLT